MQGIKLQTEQECIDLNNEIDVTFGFVYTGMTTTYSYHIPHLTDGTFLYVVDKGRISYLADLYPAVFNSLSYGLDDVVDVDKNDYIAPENENLIDLNINIEI